MPDARPAGPDPLALPPSLDSPQPGSSPSNSARFAARPHVDPGAPAWQGLKDDSIECVCSALGPHITELSVVGCTQLDGNLLLGRVNDKCPCLHTLNVSFPLRSPPGTAVWLAVPLTNHLFGRMGLRQLRECEQIEASQMALVVVTRSMKGLPRIEIRQ